MDANVAMGTYPERSLSGPAAVSARCSPGASTEFRHGIQKSMMRNPLIKKWSG